LPDLRRARSAETILVVEDAEAIRKMVCAMLTQSGYDCLEAADGTEALRLLDGGGRIRLVLTDVVMPKMGGAELAKHLARTRPEVGIIFMSGYSEDPVVKSVEQTRTEFLAKPFTAAALMEKVRRALE
jgi:two-component system, cell cycle sensor histidine kinase and response regulator CckA